MKNLNVENAMHFNGLNLASEKNKKVVRYEIFTSFDLNNSKLMDHLKWWSDKTFKESKMLEKSVDFLSKNLLYAIFAFDKNILIGAAGLIPSLNRHKEKMYCGDKFVVELASNYVDPYYRNQHVATNFVTKRLSFCKEKNFFPVSVTGSSQIQKIFTHVALLMKDFKEYTDIFKEVRVCECNNIEKLSCEICPVKEKAIWIFKGF